MAEKETESANSENIPKSDISSDMAVKEKKPVLTVKRLEAIVAIFLGIATLLSAWASWIGSLHSGVQSINFTKSNNMASQGTAEYNLGIQTYLADYMVWNIIREYSYDLEVAKADGDQQKVDLMNNKLETFKKQNVGAILSEGITWMEENNEDNPFKMPGMLEKYFASAQATGIQSQELLEEGMRDNTKGDSYSLVTVICSLTLFLLGIINTFKDMPNRIAVLVIAVVCLIVAFVYMCTIPLPTGFAQMNFFKFD